MQIHTVNAKFEEFTLPSAPALDATVVIPTVRSKWFVKYGEHAYYFMDLKKGTGLSATIRHKDIIRPGITRLRKFLPGSSNPLAMLGNLFRSYHYGFRAHEQLMLMTVPHTVTHMGRNQYLINLWA